MELLRSIRNLKAPRLSLTALVLLFAMLPLTGAAQVVELPQEKMRQLVAQSQVLNAQSIISYAKAVETGDVIDIRGFSANDRMTYRLLIQRPNGTIVEVLFDGQSGQRIQQSTRLGQIVSTTAQSSTRIKGDMLKP